jgi:hypothetical protein
MRSIVADSKGSEAQMRPKGILAAQIGNDPLFGTGISPVAARQTDVPELNSSALLALTGRRFIACHDKYAGQSPGQSRLNRHSKA